ncbi:hypothetical protein [Stagnimonas aquatica]|nr:hypothetical protein [Stagnimonas aquatica]
MKVLRPLIVWLIVILLPLQAVAASAMMQCKDMGAASPAEAAQQDGPVHDHAAMMAAMGADMDMSGMDHAAMDHEGSEHKTSSGAGCDCGCQCAASCSVGCATVAAFVTPVFAVVDFSSGREQARETREQAHAAYRYDPLRPPSAVAL